MTDASHEPVGVTGASREPAGGFLDWLRTTRRAHQTHTAVDVPCGDCVACCTSSYFVHIRPDDEGTLRRVPAELLFPTPGAPKGHVVMGYDQRGRCPMLEEGRCSIYEDRPLTCRTYDCRVFAAADIEADRPAIAARARTWAFGYPTEDDRRAHAAAAPGVLHRRCSGRQPGARRAAGGRGGGRLPRCRSDAGPERARPV